MKSICKERRKSLRETHALSPAEHVIPSDSTPAPQTCQNKRLRCKRPCTKERWNRSTRGPRCIPPPDPRHAETPTTSSRLWKKIYNPVPPPRLTGPPVPPFSPPNRSMHRCQLRGPGPTPVRSVQFIIAPFRSVLQKAASRHFVHTPPRIERNATRLSFVRAETLPCAWQTCVA